MRTLPQVPTVADLLRMSSAEVDTLVDQAFGWPPESALTLSKNLRAAGERQLREADELAKRRGGPRLVSTNDN